MAGLHPETLSMNPDDSPEKGRVDVPVVEPVYQILSGLV
jgi:hypothetical protein